MSGWVEFRSAVTAGAVCQMFLLFKYLLPPKPSLSYTLFMPSSLFMWCLPLAMTPLVPIFIPRLFFFLFFFFK